MVKVVKKRQFIPTEIGFVVNGMLMKHFPGVIDVGFTARMEEELDEIAAGDQKCVNVLNDFYGPFEKTLRNAREKMENVKPKDESTNEVCEKCGKPMVVREGRFGKFLACSGFPECRNTMAIPYGKCPREGCDGFVVERKTKRKRSFYGCSRYPDCDFMTWDKPSSDPCPGCGSIMAERSAQGVKKLICQRESCGHSMELVDEKKEKVLVKT